jgi:hypothetical protein|tara:strand:+ start:11 stop:1843 length:1833 start_codon:yes stop_codon:yes gene_type:complete
MANFTEFNLPTNAYTGFDAQSLRDLIIDRINNDTTINFTDQNFEGSNISALIDIIAYSYHTLLFYLNQTSSESNFNDAELYENINRIVKLIDYKPVGKQTAVLPVEIKGTSDLSAGYYTIPKFSFATSQGKTFTFTKDVTFEKTTSDTETISAIGSQLMYEGTLQEYPIINPIGEKFEVVNLLPGGNTTIDHFNIYVYVKEVNSNNKWYEWSRVPSLYLSKPNERSFEIRYNENKNYELKFGNSVNGRKLNQGDQIAVYYLKSSGTDGKVTKNTFNSSSLNIYNTSQYDNILTDTQDTSLNFLTIETVLNTTISNTEDSTDFGEEENADEIKQNAPRFFSSEYKLTTKDDYKSFIERNYKNLVYDVTVQNNSDYTNDYLKYLDDELGLTDYSLETNALFNQYYFADSSDANNIYLTIVPNLRKNKSVITRSNYLSNALKEKIRNEIADYKLLNSEIAFIDPVYLNLDLSLRFSGEVNRLRYKDSTQLVITKQARALINEDDLKSKVYNIITTYINNLKLGDTIDVRYLNNEIEKIQGIEGIETLRTDLNRSTPGLSFCVFNPIYNGKDKKVFDTRCKLKPYQIPYIESPVAFKDKIVVKSQVTNKRVVEY